MYADYEFYSEKFGGTLIPSDFFDFYCNKAGKYLDSIVTRAIHEPYTEDVRLAVCELCDIDYKAENNMLIVSETVGRSSVTYAGQAKSVDKQKKDVIAMYLGNTDYLCRWL